MSMLNFEMKNNEGEGDCFYYAVVDAVRNLAKINGEFKNHLLEIGMIDLLGKTMRNQIGDRLVTKLKEHLKNSIIPSLFNTPHIISLMGAGLKEKFGRNPRMACNFIKNVIDDKTQWGFESNEPSCYIIFMLLKTNVFLYEELSDSESNWYITSYFIKDGTSFRSSIDGRINEEEIQGLYESSINIFFGTNHYMALIPKSIP